ncbi:SUKH-3 domain-containing protein [Nocardia sp. NBC_01503]|uniref:SUKH-3 domain-containing protein n=1 Tax=Nocardia sp. NBC_01503 TaxID=2975997 RepID=UPI002E7C1223|nr:SUKH-3 domain-containing protein [Nocardia sp. NBC_01503]WTL33940.1 SUKH-3 domain-containing protein [Nocardia sp. NBC_01503]
MTAHISGVHRLLIDAGWTPDRDIGSRADEMIQSSIADARRQGVELEELDTASRFIHSYGDLELQLPGFGESRLVLSPTAGYVGDVEDFAELATSLNCPVFQVAYDTHEFGLWLVDARGRFFYHHHTGWYFLGHNEYEALASAFGGGLLPDAEDYFV